MTLEKPKALNRDTIVVIALVIVKIILQMLVINPVYDLHRDEYLHLDQANHLAWGYESVPPFTSWISFVIKLLGNGVFWVKLFPALFGAATIVVAWKIVELLEGSFYAKLLTGLALVFSVLFRINILYQPNSFDILCWTTLYACLIAWIKTSNRKYLYWLAIVFALGFLNKYSIVFLAAGIFAGLLLTTERSVFTRQPLWLAALLAVLLIAPNLYWQWQHGFPVVHHMNELAATQLVYVQRSDFLLDQVKFFAQALIIIIFAIAGFFLHQPFKKYRVILFSYLICMALFLFFKAKSYYALGLYPVYISFGAVYLDHLLRSGWKRRLRPVLIIVTVALSYPYLIRLPLLPPEQLATKEPFKSTGPHIWEDGKDHGFPQDYADMLGWKELADKAAQVFRSLPASEYTLIRTDNYGQAGAINYYASLNAVSHNADYVNWFDLSKPVRNMILVKDAGDTSMTRERMLFEKVYLADSIVNPFARERGATIFVLFHALSPINEILANDVREEQERLTLH